MAAQQAQAAVAVVQLQNKTKYFINNVFKKNNQLVTKTAILIFSRSAGSESNFKKLHTNRAGNAKLHQAFYNKTLGIVKETGLPFILINEARQRGNNFGEKFCNAIEFSFSQGYNKIITVGNDCSALSATDILQANDYLQKNNNAIGPDNHGGFYLLALQKNDYSRESFLNFTWCSKTLFAEINRYFLNHVSSACSQLGFKADINNTCDIVALVKQEDKNLFIQILIRIFFTFRKAFAENINAFTSCLINIVSRRGPPAVKFYC